MVAKLILAIALVTGHNLAAQSADHISGDLFTLTFAGSRGLLAGTYSTEATNYFGEYFYSKIPPLNFRSIGRFQDVTLSPTGRYLAGHGDNTITVLEFPSCRRVYKSAGDDSGSFNPVESEFAWPSPIYQRNPEIEDLLICRLRDGHVRSLKNFRTDIARYVPKHGQAKYFEVSSWSRNGIEISVTFETRWEGKVSEVSEDLYVDPVKDRITGRVPAMKSGPKRFNLPDGSLVYDELADDEASMLGQTRIVRVSRGKKAILFARNDISAGHEMSADLLIPKSGDKVLVFGVDRQVNKARIWQINPLTRNRSLIASGAYSMPSWADGASMFVDVSADGKWLAYGDFIDHKKVRVKRLHSTPTPAPPRP